MAFKHVLKSTLEPKIPLKEMAIWNDTNEGEPPKEGFAYTSSSSKYNNKERTGSGAPLVQINEYTIPDHEIETMILDETGFIPKITVIFEDSSEHFGPVQFPNRNPILSLYIKSTHEKMKPIRNDYIITSIKGSETKVIKGELFIPGIYTNISKSYGEVTSNEALFKVCEDLGLGFQSNETSPNDAMKWVNPNWNSADFMKHLIRHAYQDDQTFFDAFIDKYYHLNYIDANIQLEQDGEFDNTIYAGSQDFNMSESRQTEYSKQVGVIESGLIGHPKIKSGANTIREKHLMTENGEVLIKDGFRKRIYYYDYFSEEEDPTDNLLDFYVQPIVSNNKILREKSLEPTNTQLKDTEIRKWVNIQYKNTHSNYVAAKVINSHNLNELKKIRLKVTTAGINVNSTRGMRIPVGIYDSAAEAVNMKLTEPEASKETKLRNVNMPDSEVYNEFLSGIYYSTGCRYIYDSMVGFTTELVLSKRDWVPNPEI